jgi:hypothetical protein
MDGRDCDTHRLNQDCPTFITSRADPAQSSTVNRNYYDPDRRIRKSSWPSFSARSFQRGPIKPRTLTQRRKDPRPNSMSHESSLIATLALSLMAALIGALAAARLRCPSLVGYLLGGVLIPQGSQLIGPTPEEEFGFDANKTPWRFWLVRAARFLFPSVVELWLHLVRARRKKQNIEKERK